MIIRVAHDQPRCRRRSKAGENIRITPIDHLDFRNAIAVHIFKSNATMLSSDHIDESKCVSELENVVGLTTMRTSRPLAYDDTGLAFASQIGARRGQL